MATDPRAGQRKTWDDVQAMVQSEIDAAIKYDKAELSGKRARAIEYYEGEMSDTPSEPNRSRVVSRDLSDTINWMLASLMRTFMGANRLVEYEPQGPEDEDVCDQASDYINYVFLRQNDGYRVLQNVLHDTLLHGNGIIKHWWDDTPETEPFEFHGLTADALTMVQQDDTLEITHISEEQITLGAMPGDTDEPVLPPQPPEMGSGMDGAPDGAGVGPDSPVPPVAAPQALEPQPQAITLYSIKGERMIRPGRIRVECVAPEDFFIDKECVVTEEARFAAHRREVTRSELLEMGFAEEIVDELPGDRMSRLDDEENIARDGNDYTGHEAIDRAAELIELFHCVMAVDMDGDGRSEWVEAYYAGDAGGGGRLLSFDQTEIRIADMFTDVPCIPIPHRWDAMSIADLMFDVQQINTILNRKALDNLYAHMNPQKEVEEGSVLNRDALVNPKFGQPIFKKRGSAPIIPHDISFVADKALMILQHMDQIAERRTGISRQSMALDPDALQNQTATAVQKQQDASHTKVEWIARNIAYLGLRKMFRALLRLAVKHQEHQEVIRLRNDWVEMDPRYWNASMDCTVNVGLGTGSRDRDMAMLGQILQDQMMAATQLADRGLPEKAMEYIEKVIDTMVKRGEAGGLANAEGYHIEITPEDRMAALQKLSAPPPPDPKAEAEQAKLQLMQEKAKLELQLKQQEMQADIERERQQMMAEVQLERERMILELQMSREGNQAKLAGQALTRPVSIGGRVG